MQYMDYKHARKELELNVYFTRQTVHTRDIRFPQTDAADKAPTSSEVTRSDKEWTRVRYSVKYTNNKAKLLVL